MPDTARAGDFDRPAGDPHQSRSVAVAEHGIVATSQPLAVLGRARCAQTRRQRGRCGHRRQCRDRALSSP